MVEIEERHFDLVMDPDIEFFKPFITHYKNTKKQTKGVITHSYLLSNGIWLFTFGSDKLTIMTRISMYEDGPFKNEAGIESVDRFLRYRNTRKLESLDELMTLFKNFIMKEKIEEFLNDN